MGVIGVGISVPPLMNALLTLFASRPRFAPVMNWVACSCSFCLAMLAWRLEWSGRTSFYFLSWNLLLALAPLFFAWVSMLISDLGWKHLALVVLLPWLLFLPNAPYILTDLLHLKARTPVPLWFDLTMLLAFALTGLMLGYLSMVCAERVLLRVMKRPWVMVIHGLVLFLCGFGIYLGRFLRWNSWEVATRPRALLRDLSARLLHPEDHPTTWMTTLLVGAMLIMVFALVRHVGSSIREEAVVDR